VPNCFIIGKDGLIKAKELRREEITQQLAFLHQLHQDALNSRKIYFPLKLAKVYSFPSEKLLMQSIDSVLAFRADAKKSEAAAQLVTQLIFSSNFIPLDIIHTSKNHPIYISNL